MIGNSVLNVLRRFLLQRQVSFLRSSQSQLKNTLLLPSKTFSSSASVFPNNPFTIIIFPSPPLRSPHFFCLERPLLIPRCYPVFCFCFRCCHYCQLLLFHLKNMLVQIRQTKNLKGYVASFTCLFVFFCFCYCCHCCQYYSFVGKYAILQQEKTKELNGCHACFTWCFMWYFSFLATIFAS